MLTSSANNGVVTIDISGANRFAESARLFNSHHTKAGGAGAVFYNSAREHAHNKNNMNANNTSSSSSCHYASTSGLVLRTKQSQAGECVATSLPIGAISMPSIKEVNAVMKKTTTQIDSTKANDKKSPRGDGRPFGALRPLPSPPSSPCTSGGRFLSGKEAVFLARLAQPKIETMTSLTAKAEVIASKGVPRPSAKDMRSAIHVTMEALRHGSEEERKAFGAYCNSIRKSRNAPLSARRAVDAFHNGERKREGKGGALSQSSVPAVTSLLPHSERVRMARARRIYNSTQHVMGIVGGLGSGRTREATSSFQREGGGEEEGEKGGNFIPKKPLVPSPPTTTMTTLCSSLPTKLVIPSPPPNALIAKMKARERDIQCRIERLQRGGGGEEEEVTDAEAEQMRSEILAMLMRRLNIAVDNEGINGRSDNAAAIVTAAEAQEGVGHAETNGAAAAKARLLSPMCEKNLERTAEDVDDDEDGGESEPSSSRLGHHLPLISPRSDQTSRPATRWITASGSDFSANLGAANATKGKAPSKGGAGGADDGSPLAMEGSDEEEGNGGKGKSVNNSLRESTLSERNSHHHHHHHPTAPRGQNNTSTGSSVRSQHHSSTTEKHTISAGGGSGIDDEIARPPFLSSSSSSLPSPTAASANASLTRGKRNNNEDVNTGNTSDENNQRNDATTSGENSQRQRQRDAIPNTTAAEGGKETLSQPTAMPLLRQTPLMGLSESHNGRQHDATHLQTHRAFHSSTSRSMAMAKVTVVDHNNAKQSDWHSDAEYKMNFVSGDTRAAALLQREYNRRLDALARKLLPSCEMLTSNTNGGHGNVQGRGGANGAVPQLNLPLSNRHIAIEYYKLKLLTMPLPPILTGGPAGGCSPVDSIHLRRWVTIIQTALTTQLFLSKVAEARRERVEAKERQRRATLRAEATAQRAAARWARRAEKGLGSDDDDDDDDDGSNESGDAASPSSSTVSSNGAAPF